MWRAWRVAASASCVFVRSAPRLCFLRTASSRHNVAAASLRVGTERACAVVSAHAPARGFCFGATGEIAGGTGSGGAGGGGGGSGVTRTSTHRPACGCVPGGQGGG